MSQSLISIIDLLAACLFLEEEDHVNRQLNEIISYMKGFRYHMACETDAEVCHLSLLGSVTTFPLVPCNIS